MDTRSLIYVISGVFGAIIGVYVWVAKHIAARKKHPCSDDLVFKDVCEERSGRLQDCIESEVRFSKERYETLTKKIDDGFKEIKEELKNARN